MNSVRERIQQERKELNRQIFKSLKTCQGAENLVKATNSKEHKEKAVLELSYIQSQWAVLREKLHELNSNIESYQNRDGGFTLTMLAVGLKESLDFDTSSKSRFCELIMEHYGENPKLFDKEIDTFLELRRKAATPTRNAEGVKLLREYMNHLFLVESRFFKSEFHSNGIQFSWFDCLSGTLHTQGSIDFEKACIFFNLGSLHSQLATKQDRSTSQGAWEALEHYQRAAGYFKYVGKYFANTPGLDLSEKCQEILRSLMLSQAQECLFEAIALEENAGEESPSKMFHYLLAILDCYNNLESRVRTNTDVPQAWLVLITAKNCHYRALVHFYAAKILLSFKVFPAEFQNNILEDDGMCKDTARAYLDVSIEKHSDAIRKVKSNRHLKSIDGLIEILQHTDERSNELFRQWFEGDKNKPVLDFFDVKPLKVVYPVELMVEIEPDLDQIEVVDLFYKLGPLSTFNARNNWKSEKKTTLTRKSSKDSFGLSVKGNVPVTVESVDRGGIAESAGLKAGDLIVRINGIDVKWAFHKEVVALIKQAGNSFVIHTTSIINESKFMTL